MWAVARTRLLAASMIALVIPLGLLARSHRAGATLETLDGFLATYAGDTLWPVMFYFMGRFVWPAARCRTLVWAVLAITLGLEFSQLWKPPLLQFLRAQPISGFILGNHFIWSDVVCCLAGTALAFVIDWLFLDAQKGSDSEGVVWPG